MVGFAVLGLCTVDAAGVGATALGALAVRAGVTIRVIAGGSIRNMFSIERTFRAGASHRQFLAVEASKSVTTAAECRRGARGNKWPRAARLKSLAPCGLQ